MIRNKLSVIRRNYHDRSWWRTQLMNRAVKPYSAKTTPSLAGGIDIMGEAWDNLIVLDACRADLFEEAAPVDDFDEYRRVSSRGSSTNEWIRKNFVEKEFGDTVYVTGNPNTSQLAPNAFHELVESWVTDFDEEIGTVHAEPIIRDSLRALDRHPDKRLIAHFMQPHHPFITRPDVQFDGWSAEQNGDSAVAVNTDVEMHPWKALEQGLVDEGPVREAYRENLEAVLDDVLSFAHELPGRTVITSDHGNAFGERARPVPLRVYGHPSNVRVEGLVRVPWAVIDGPRRDTVDEGAGSQSDAASVDVESRLQALGYTE